jgi:hypothetical protein
VLLVETSTGVPAQADQLSDELGPSVSEILGLEPLGPEAAETDILQSLGSAEIFDGTSPEHCDQVMSRFDSLARGGMERVSCFSSTTEDEVDESFSSAAIPEVTCTGREPDRWWVSRRTVCMRHSWYHRIFNPYTAEEMGRATFYIQQEIQFRNTQTSPAKAQEFVSVTLEDRWGEATNPAVDWDSGCVGCDPSTEELQPWLGYALFTAEGQTVQKRWDRDIPVALGSIERPIWNWKVKFRAGGFTTSMGADSVPIGIRCDNQVGENFGCAVSVFNPTLQLDYADRQAGALFVSIGSRLNNHWWGWEEKSRPLTRLADEEDAEANRTLICPATFVPDPSVLDASCDEFPFAATYQSRGNGEIYNGDRCQQLTSEQQPNGDWDLFPIGTWDANAPCLRATTPLDQNRNVGGDLGRFAVSSRLLDGDSYYVNVYDSRL